ncbi:MAG: hypothetical protein Q8P57_04625 [Candidatus Pacearchaeota archaeon]|nr:hypothetical protein [Candidatus Pacearchaeota archaeon]
MKRWRVILGILFLIMGVFVLLGTEGVYAQAGIAVDDSGNIYVSQTIQSRIVKIDSSGVESVFAGGEYGYLDGEGTNARFKLPGKIMFGPDGYLYVADEHIPAIRKISPSGLVSTVAGDGNIMGSTNGALNDARFSHITGLFVTTLGEILVLDKGNSKVRLIKNPESPNGQVIDIAGGYPFSLVSPIHCNAMNFGYPIDIIAETKDVSGNSYSYDIIVADKFAHVIWAFRYSEIDGVTSGCQGTYFGEFWNAGYHEGNPTQMPLFSGPLAIEAFDYSSDGNPKIGYWNNDLLKLWISDGANFVIRYFTNERGYPETTPFTSTRIPFSYMSGDNYNGFASWYSPGGTPFVTPSIFLRGDDILVKANNAFEYSGDYNFYFGSAYGPSFLRKLTDNNPEAADGVWKSGIIPINLEPNSCQNEDDVILRLSNPYGAYGEVYNGAGNYRTEICYSNVFGQTAPENPDRTCANLPELVLRLSSETGALAEVPEGNSVFSNPVDVCYEGLDCRSVGVGSCDIGETEVVSLSEDTNALLGIAGTYGYVGTAKICCSVSATPEEFSNLKWLDFSNKQIPDTNPNQEVCVGNWVKTFSSSGFDSGNEVEFKIYDNDLIFNDPIKTLTGSVDGNGNVYAEWEITGEDYNAGGTEGNLEIYFNVKDISSGVVSDDSYTIDLTNDPSKCQNSGPTAEIIAPVHRGIYFINDEITFISGCSSPLGPVNSEWKIEQPQGTVIEEKNEDSFSYTFENAGQALVSLTCTDSEGLKARTEAIMNVAGNDPEVLTYINLPGLDGIAENPNPESGPYFPTQVHFNADESYAVITAGSSELPIQGLNTNTCIGVCLAGDCPEKSEGIPSGCTEQIDILSAGSVSLEGGFGDLYFDWKFWDNNWNTNAEEIDGLGFVDGYIQYDDVSNALNDKHMSLEIKTGENINDLFSGSDYSSNFERRFTLGRCLSSGSQYLNLDGNFKDTLSEQGACFGGDGDAGTRDDCCPSGYLCSEDEETCILDDSGISFCEDYLTESACIADSSNVASASIGGQTQLGICEYSRCLWEGNECVVNVVSYPLQPGNQCGSSINPNNNPDGCSYKVEETECESGEKTISYMILSGDNTLCARTGKTIPCGGLNFELGFFGYLQFISAGLIIILIYIGLGLRKDG